VVETQRRGASQRWIVSIQLHPSVLHLPRKQVRTGGGPSLNFNTIQASPTSLASKCELGVVFFRLFRHTCPSSTFLAFKCELEVSFFDVSTPVPPPSHPNVSRRCFFPAVSMFLPPSSTSLVFKRELEVVLSNVSMPLLLPPPNANQRWIFRQFQRRCYHFRGGGFFWRVGTTDATTTTTSLVLTLCSIPPVASRTTWQCETHTPPYSNVFPNIISTLKTRKKFWKPEVL
jgi:hypothetical protein